MIKIKMLTTSAGPDGNHKSGDVYDEIEDIAQALVNGRYAEYVEPPQKDGENDGVKNNNSAGNRTLDTGRSKTVSKGGRKR